MQYATYMFGNCTKIKGGKGTTYVDEFTTFNYAHIDGGTDNPGYFTKKPDFLLGDVNRSMGAVCIENDRPGGRDGFLVRGIQPGRSCRHNTFRAFFQIIRGAQGDVPRSDAVCPFPVDGSDRSQEALRDAGCSDLRFLQVGNKVQVNGFSGSNGGCFRPREAKEP